MKLIDDIAVDRSASYRRKYLLSRIEYLWKRIFHRYYDKKLEKMVKEYEQIHSSGKIDC